MVESDPDMVELQALLAEDISTYEQVDKKEECKIFKKMLPDDPILMAQIQGTLPKIPKDIVAKALFDIAERQKWDKANTEWKVLETDEAKNGQLVHYKVKTPMIMSDRDYCAFMRKLEDQPSEGKITVCSKSVVTDKCPEVKKVVRGTIKKWYFVIEDDGQGGSKYTLIVQNDAGGSVPKSFVNSKLTKSPPEFRTNLIKGCEALMK